MDFLLSYFGIASVLAMLCSNVCSQSLYDDDNRNYEDINTGSKLVVFQSLLHNAETTLRESINRLQETRNRENLMTKYFDEIFSIYMTKRVPNDTTIDEVCVRHPNLVLRSPTDCHRYYNCSGGVGSSTECSYPFLFSDETLQCENYTKVSCGTRYEPKWVCEYSGMTCMRANCIPCSVSNPSCRGLKDGLQPWSSRPTSPYYVVCENERAVDQGLCPVDAIWNSQEFPYKGRCVQRFAIPTVDNPNGALPSCNGTSDGNYQYPDRKCDAYYKCECGVASAVKCPNNTVFDSVRKTCEVGGTCN